MLIEIVCLNLNRRDTLQQPVATYRPASRANQKAETKRIHQCTYTVQQCLYISGNKHSHLYTAHHLYRTACTSSSGGRPVQTSCTPCRLCRLFKPFKTTENKTLEFRSREVGDVIRPIKLTGIRKEPVQLGEKGGIFNV